MLLISAMLHTQGVPQEGGEGQGVEATSKVLNGLTKLLCSAVRQSSVGR